MQDHSADFTWFVCLEGHRWIETTAFELGRRARQPSQPFLSDGLPARALRDFRSYRPLVDHTGLFRTFAETPPTAEGIQSFADRFGLLGGDVTERIRLPRQRGQKSTSLGLGERSDLWTNAILEMRRAVELWWAVHELDTESLQQWIIWRRGPDGSGVLYRRPAEPDLEAFAGKALPPSGAKIATQSHDPEVMERFAPGDLAGPALLHVERVINRHLTNRVQARLQQDPNTARRYTGFAPDGLIGALWLQLAHAVEHDKNFRRCAECTNWFEVRPSVGRADKEFCSNACRTRAYRRRQAEALKLHAEGLDVEAIARHVSSDATTVTGWLRRARRTP